MIRKAIIVVLAIATTGAGLAWVSSYRRSAPIQVVPMEDHRTLGAFVDDGPPSPVVLANENRTRTFEHSPVGFSRLFIVRGGILFAGFSRGRVRFQYVGPEPRSRGESAYHTFTVDRSASIPCLYASYSGTADFGHPVYSLAVWLWFPFVLFATYPTIAFIRGPVGRWRRRRRGLCVTCAYNLTGNVSGVCPECEQQIG